MTPEPTSTKVVARYALRHGGGWLAISGLIVLGFIIRMIVQPEERDATIAFLAILVTGIASVGVVMALVGLRAVEVTASGTLDFVSWVKRDSFPRTSLMRVEGKTNAGAKGGRSHWAVFIFTEAGQKETEKKGNYSAIPLSPPYVGKNAKKVSVPRKDDPAFQEFVRQLEILNPRLDTSQFWAWSRGAEVTP